MYHADGTNEITCSLLVLPDTMQITLRKEPVSQIAVPFEYCVLYVFFFFLGGGGGGGGHRNYVLQKRADSRKLHDADHNEVRKLNNMFA